MDKILILDLGGACADTVARRVRENRVYSEIKPHTVALDEIKNAGYKGMILVGTDTDTNCNKEIFELGLPILAVSRGAEAMTEALGGAVDVGAGDSGCVSIALDGTSSLFSELPPHTAYRTHVASHISRMPLGFRISAKTANCPVAAMENPKKHFYAVQFHPDIVSTELGAKMISNFLFKICNCTDDWLMTSFTGRAVNSLKEKLGDKKVFCVLNGSIEASVTALLLHRAVGDNLTCLFIDHGMFRKGEVGSITDLFKKRCEIKLLYSEIGDSLTERLSGVTDFTEKCQIFDDQYLTAFKSLVSGLGKVDIFADSTLYPEHYADMCDPKNLREYIDFAEVIEPLRNLYDFEVRKVGFSLGMPEDMAFRPNLSEYGLGCGIIGDITRERVELLRTADAVLCEETDILGLDRGVYYFELLAESSVLEGYTLILRTASSDNGEHPFPSQKLITAVTQRVAVEMPDIGRVFCDITAE